MWVSSFSCSRSMGCSAPVGVRDRAFEMHAEMNNFRVLALPVDKPAFMPELSTGLSDWFRFATQTDFANFLLRSFRQRKTLAVLALDALLALCATVNAWGIAVVLRAGVP